jgi:hypothetical protein
VKIVAVEIENIKRIKSVRIEPKGYGLIIIKGRNGAGKSSVLDAIMYACEGEHAVCEKPVREGQDNGFVRLTLEDLVIEKKWTQGGKHSYLELRDATGQPLRSPQKRLDALFSKIGFDPLAFVRQKPEHQIETLRKLAGLDFTKHDAKAKSIYDERTVVNREIKSLEARLNALPVVNAPDEEQSASELATRLADLEALRAANSKVDTAQARVDDIEKQLAAAKEAATAAKDAWLKIYNKCGRPQNGAEQSVVIQAKLRDIDQVNRRVAQKRERALVSNQVATKKARADALSAHLEELESAKRKAIEDAELPAGLSFTETGVTLNAMPLLQASSAEQVTASTNVGMLLQPNARLLLVREGSLLDDDSLAALDACAKEMEGYVVIERVGDHDATGVLIEEGEVVRVDEEAEEAEDPNEVPL